MFRRRKFLWFQYSAVLALTLLLGGCRQMLEISTPAERLRERFKDKEWQTRKIQQGKNFVVAVPAFFTAEQDGNSLIIGIANTRSLAPTRITFVASAKQPTGSFAGRRTVAGRTIQFRIEKNESNGSGGAEYNVEAWESCRDGYIFYQGSEQLEQAAANNDLTWYLIENTRCLSAGEAP